MTPVTLPVKYVQQQRIGECLAACSAMVMNYLGKPIAYRRLVSLLEIIPDAGTASSKIRNLSQLGVKVIYQQGSFDKLHEHLLQNQPCIVFVKTSELPYRNDATDHAIVVVGLDDQNVYINDPEFIKSPISVPRGDFNLAWLEHDEMYAVLST